MVGDGVEVEEAGGGDAFLVEDAGAGAVVGFVGEEPGGAERDGAWGCGDFGQDVLLEGSGEGGGSDDVRGEAALLLVS